MTVDVGTVHTKTVKAPNHPYTNSPRKDGFVLSSFRYQAVLRSGDPRSRNLGAEIKLPSGAGAELKGHSFVSIKQLCLVKGTLICFYHIALSS
jgi:hypothetical protein